MPDVSIPLARAILLVLASCLAACACVIWRNRQQWRLTAYTPLLTLGVIFPLLILVRALLPHTLSTQPPYFDRPVSYEDRLRQLEEEQIWRNLEEADRYAKERRLEGTGTGFAVSQDGQIVTNHHVVAECAEVRVRPGGREALAGAVLAQDPGNDLALLRVPVHMAAAALRDDGGIRAGDSVVAVGFPLPGLLASEASVTTGTVSALAGIGNDPRLFQVTVPVQPGNSGGPLLDLHGRVVGIVVGKLDAVQIASVTGDIPQNVNFAIKAGILRSFLDTSGVAVAHRDLLADPAYAIPLSPAAVAAEAKAFTVLVECWK